MIDEKIFEGISEGVKKSLLHGASGEILKQVCRSRGIKGFSGKKKSELVCFVFTKLSEEELKKVFIELSKNVERIKDFVEREQNRIRKYNDVITQSDELLRSDPNNITAWDKKIDALIRLKNLEEALQCVDNHPQIIGEGSYEFLEKKTNLLTIMERNEEALKIINNATIIESEAPYVLELKAEIYRNLKDEEGEFECCRKIINKAHYFNAPMFLRTATIMIDRGEFAEAVALLDQMYGCESHDTLWAPALFQKARAAALQNNLEDMLENIKRAMRTTVFFSWDSGAYSKYRLLGDIARASEFDKYRGAEEFQFILNFDWEREDEIELENKMKHYFKVKNLNREKLDAAHLGLIEYLCRHPESEIYLDFDFDETRRQVLLTNKSESIAILANDHYILKNIKKSPKFLVDYIRDEFEPFHWKLEEIKKVTKPAETTYNFDGVKYKKVDVDNVLEILKEAIHAYIPNKRYPLILTSSEYSLIEDDYKTFTKRKSYDYSILILPRDE